MATMSIRAPRSRRLLPGWLWPAPSDRGIEHVNLVRTGLALVVCYLSLMFLPDSAYSYSRFVVHPFGLLWVGMALPKLTRPLRFAFPFVILLLLQVWMVISMVCAQQFIPKPIATGMYLWYPLEFGMVYLVTLVLGTLQPSALRYTINWLLLFCAISAGVAILQALHFGPAIRIADFYVYRSIEGWDKVAGVRASGLSTNPNVNLMSMLVAAGLIAYKTTRRNLRWYDYSMWGLFIVSSFFAQHRSSMPLVGLTFLVTLFILFQRRPIALVAVFVSSVLMLTLAATVFKHNFAYTFETAWSSSAPQLKSRFDAEDQAYEYFKLYPFTGVGPSPAPEALARPTSASDLQVENLYYAIMLTLGVPGLVLLLALYGSALVLAVGHSLNRLVPRDTRVLMVVCVLAVVGLIWNGNVAVNLTQFHIMCSYMVLLAIGQLQLAARGDARRLRVSPYLQTRDNPGRPLARL